MCRMMMYKSKKAKSFTSQQVEDLLREFNYLESRQGGHGTSLLVEVDNEVKQDNIYEDNLSLEVFGKFLLFKSSETFDVVKDVLKQMLELKLKGFIYHTRLVSSGSYGLSNTHPATTKRFFLFQNGTEHYSELVAKALGVSWDTEITAKLIEKAGSYDLLMDTSSVWFLVDRKTSSYRLYKPKYYSDMEVIEWKNGVLFSSDFSLTFQNKYKKSEKLGEAQWVDFKWIKKEKKKKWSHVYGSLSNTAYGWESDYYDWRKKWK